MLSVRFFPRNEILIVDDDELQRDLMRNALEDLGLVIHEAADGAEALDIFRKRNPTLVVMDINMPVMDGLTACREMNRIPGSEAAAIIMVTGMDDIADVRKAYDLGAREFITKPLDWPMFQMRVKYIMRIQQGYLKVRHSREKLMWAQHAAAVGLWEFDAEARTIRLFDDTIQVLGLPPGRRDYPVREFLAAISPADRESLSQAYEAVLRSHEPINLDAQFNLDDGRKLFVHIYGEETPGDAGAKSNISGTIQDITKRKLAERKLQEAVEMKDQFLTNMNHELRTPVNGIMGMTELLSHTDMTTDQVQWTTNILRSSRHLVDLLDDILDFAAIAAGKVTIRQEPFDLRQTLAKVLDTARSQAGKKNLTLSLDIQADLPEMVNGDADRLRQVFSILTDNASKFTGEGLISIRASLCEQAVGSDHLCFAVKDTGIGIPRAKQPRIFDQFVQADGTLTRNHQGTGLGLATCRKLVELMGGTIGVVSAQGQGTEVWFRLPLGQVETPGAKATVPELPAIPASFTPQQYRILLVEDNAINRLFVKKILEQLGFVVDVADNGEKAVSQVRIAAYDAVLMDCQMPVMDGYEATRTIRSLGPGYHELPIIALTAHALQSDRDKCLNSGMDDYMSKPADGQEIFQTLAKWLCANDMAN